MPTNFNEIVERIYALKEQSKELWSKNDRLTDEMVEVETELDQLLITYNELVNQAG